MIVGNFCRFLLYISLVSQIYLCCAYKIEIFQYFLIFNFLLFLNLIFQNPKLLVLGNSTQMKSSSRQNIYHSQHENSSSRSSSTAAPSPCFPTINNNNPTHNNYNNNNNNVENNPPSQRTDSNGIGLPLTPSGGC